MDGSSYGYAGEWTDSSGLQYLRARYYSPATGRFISKDPFPGLLTQPASLTPYVYALNSPILYSDPSGEFIDTLFDVVSVGYDLYTIGDKLNRGCAIPWTDWAALGMDAFSLAVPFLPAAGMAIRFAAHADDLGDFARAVNKIVDNIKFADKLGDSGKYGIRQIGSPCSFSEDTLVATQEGEKPIDEVEIGDKVLAYDENSHSTGYFPVVDKFVHLDQEIVTLVIDGETIETTSEHPFFTEEKGWIPAGELWIGALILRSDGLSGKVENVATQQSDRMMFNLTVDQAHTFYVGEGQWLVHNTCWGLRPGGGRIQAQQGGIGEELANDAKNFYATLTREEARGTTIAIGRLNGQYTFPVVNGSAPQGVAEKIGAIQAPGSMHAERYLYELFNGNLDAIGVSNAKGSCLACTTFFSDKGFWNVFFNDVFR